jgi:hypothetical protein
MDSSAEKYPKAKNGVDLFGDVDDNESVQVIEVEEIDDKDSITNVGKGAH